MRDVMRLEAGAEVTVIDDANVEYRGQIKVIASDHAIVAVSETRRATVEWPEIILAVALIRGPRMDFVVEKAAELGASELVPLACKRAVVREPGSGRIDRWRRIAIAAAKQSLSARRMIIRAPVTVAELAQSAREDVLAVVCTPAGAPLGSVLRKSQSDALIVACGPEGGFEDQEMELMAAAGFEPATLGPNRLRTETAALAALSIAGGALVELSRSR
jgi:16S rRNA (uracil1498-N3)-methyltransferase